MGKERERKRERGASQRGRTKFISPPSARYRGRYDARFPPGKKSIAIRKLAPPNDDIHPLPPSGPRASARPFFPREFLGIPRLVTGGGDRVRFAISPTNTSTPNQTTPAERIHRRRHRRGPETFAGMVRVNGRTVGRVYQVYQVRKRTSVVSSPRRGC